MTARERSDIATAKRVVVKVGSSSISGEHAGRISTIVDALAASHARAAACSMSDRATMAPPSSPCVMTYGSPATIPSTTRPAMSSGMATDSAMPGLLSSITVKSSSTPIGRWIAVGCASALVSRCRVTMPDGNTVVTEMPSGASSRRSVSAMPQTANLLDW